VQIPTLSPEVTRLSPKSPRQIREVLHHLLPSKILEQQSTKAKIFDKHDYSLQSISLGGFPEPRTPETAAAFGPEAGSCSGFSGSSFENLGCSFPCSGALLSQLEQWNWSTRRPHIEASARQAQFGQETIGLADRARECPVPGKTPQRGKRQDSIACHLCGRLFSRRSELKYGPSQYKTLEY